MSEQQTPKDQISTLMGALVAHQKFLSGMPTVDRQWALQNPQAAIELLCSAVKNRAQKTKKELFEFLRTYTVPAVKKFIAKDKFVIDRSPTARVRISYLGENFKKRMLPKVEEDIVGGELRMSELLENSRDIFVSEEKPGTIASLGGESRVKVTLCDFYETLAEKQARGDYTWTVVFADDVNGVLGAVYADWHGVGWRVNCNSVDNSNEWNAGNEFVSR